MATNLPMMAIVDEATLNELISKALISAIIKIPLPPILLPPVLGTTATRLRKWPAAADRLDLEVVRFDADPAAIQEFLQTNARLRSSIDASARAPQPVFRVGYDGEVVRSAPSPPTPVAADVKNTSWMIPYPTGDVDRLHEALGLDRATALPASDRGKGVYVAVVDGGVDERQFEVAGGWAPDAGRPGAADPHGDMVAWDVRAVAPAVRFIDIAALRPHAPRKLDDGSTEQCPPPNDLCPPRLYDVAQGLAFLTDPLRSPVPAGSGLVVVCSWMVLAEPSILRQGSADDPWSLSYFGNRDHPFSLLIRQLVAAGVPVVFAAGNCGPDGFPPACDVEAKDDPAFPAIRGANGLEDVVCVGAADLDGRLLSNSPHGPSSLGAAKPDLCGYAAFAGYNTTGDLGTSAAAGVVGGVVAYLKSACPTADPAAIRNALRSGATKLAPGDASPHDTAFWGGGLVHAEAARQQLCSATAAGAVASATGLVGVVDGIVGRSPLSCQRRIRAICDNREKIFRQAALGDRERQAIERLDGAVVAALLETQLASALDQAWQGRTSLAAAEPEADETVDASCGDDRPRLLVNLIADLARSEETRAAFFADRSALVRSRYALSADSCAVAETMTRDSCADVSRRAVDEARTEFEIHPQYPNVQSFPGPWIEAFFPDRGRLGAAVPVTIEGRGFVPGRPLMVALFERRIGTDKDPQAVCPTAAKISATVSAPVDPRQRELRERRRKDLDDVCEDVRSAKETEPTVCEPGRGDLWFGRSVCKTWPPELALPELRLGELQLAENLDRDSAATRFRIEVVFDLAQPGLCAGEYDLWVGHCDATGCQGRAAVGPTTFSITSTVEAEQCSSRPRPA